MQPKIYDNCKLFAFDRDKLKFEILHPELVGVRFWNGIYDYYLLKPNGRRLLIVQALNIKKSAAKMITLLGYYEKHGI